MNMLNCWSDFKWLIHSLMKCRHTVTNPQCFMPFKRLNGKEQKQENGNDGVKRHRNWQWNNESHFNRFDVCLCELKYAFSLHHGFSILPLFIHVLYTSFRASKIYWSYRIFRTDYLFVLFLFRQIDYYF